MNNTYKIYTIAKNNSNIQGYWKDNTNKLYIDNIKIIDVSKKHLQHEIDKLFKSGELAVLVLHNNKAYIYNNDKTINILKKHIQYRINKKDKDIFIDNLLYKYNGLTSTIIKNTCIIDIWS